MKAPPIIHDECTPGVSPSYIRDMEKRFGHLLNCDAPLPMETKHFLGEVPSMDDLPDWITEEEEKKLKAHKTRGKVGVAIYKEKDALFHAGVATDRAFNLMFPRKKLMIRYSEAILVKVLVLKINKLRAVKMGVRDSFNEGELNARKIRLIQKRLGEDRNGTWFVL